jgi:hypothetical protein
MEVRLTAAERDALGKFVATETKAREQFIDIAEGTV